MEYFYLLTITLFVILIVTTFVSLLRLQFNPLLGVAGPPVSRWFGNHLKAVLEWVFWLCFCQGLTICWTASPSISRQVYQLYVSRYGRSVRIRGVGFVRRLPGLIQTLTVQTVGQPPFNIGPLICLLHTEKHGNIPKTLAVP